ncbi:glycosyltransferase family 39 protein [Candidatus Woesearchaeota archaeon]|nr:glycosyltransferase family 39 protein [Candidatus Woesearchaeota archaeon]
MKTKPLVWGHKGSTWLLIILAFALALRLVFFTGTDASDPLAYTKYANMLAKGEPINVERGDAFRIGLLLPVSVLYRMFGFNEFSSNVLVILASLASIVLIYKFGVMLFNEKAGLLSAFLLSFFPFDVLYSTRLMTELPSAFFVALSVYLFLKSEKTANKRKSYAYCLFSGLAVGMAYLIKELSVLIILFFIAYAIYNKKIRARYWLIPLGFAVIFFAESLYFLKTTGNMLFRFDTITTATYSIVLENYGRGSLPFSLFHFFYIAFTDSSLGLFYPFIFMAIFFCIARKKKDTYSLLLWLIPLFLYISFGSISLTKYILFPVTTRLFSIITFPGILLLAYFLSQEDKLIKRTLMPIILILLFVTSIGYIHVSRQKSLIDSEKATYKFIKGLGNNIYTDERTFNVFDYLSGYDLPDSIRKFNHYEPLNPQNTYAVELGKITDSYIVVNRKLVNFYLSYKKGAKFPAEIFNVPKEWALKKSVGKGENGIEVYYIP